MKDEDLYFYVMLFFMIMSFVLGTLLLFQIDKVKELGGAICQEEYDAKFKSYDSNKELTCTETHKEDSYDGVTVVKIGD